MEGVLLLIISLAVLVIGIFISGPEVSKDQTWKNKK